MTDQTHTPPAPAGTQAPGGATTPVSWFGGKRRLLPVLLPLLPPHRCYVEVFAGSAALLVAKAPAPVEVYNDLDSGLVNFFRVLRDREGAAQLYRLLQLTPYAREEWYACKDAWQACADPVERARQWYVTIEHSFSSWGARSAWAYSGVVNQARSTISAVERIPDVTKRLQQVQIDHRDFRDILPAYDSPDTLFYLDPPYHLATRGQGRTRYTHELGDSDHSDLLALATGVQGMVILSHYNHPLYEEALQGWHKHEVTTVAPSYQSTRKLGKGRGVRKEGATRIEVIWQNPACVAAHRRQLVLF